MSVRVRRSEWPDGRGRTVCSRGRQGDLGAPAPHRRRRGAGARPRHHDHRSDPAGDRRAARGVVGIRVVEVEHGVAARPRRGVDGAHRGQPGTSTGRGSQELRLLDVQRLVRGVHVRRPAGRTALAERRFRPEFRVAFDAWQATNPSTNPDAPPGPTLHARVQAARGAGGRTRSTSAADESSRPGKRRPRTRTTTCARPSTSRRCCSSSGSAATSACAPRGSVSSSSAWSSSASPR